MRPTANASKRRRRSIAGFALTQTIGAAITCACPLRALRQATTAPNRKKRNERVPMPTGRTCRQTTGIPGSGLAKQVALALSIRRATLPRFRSPAEACRQSSFVSSWRLHRKRVARRNKTKQGQTNRNAKRDLQLSSFRRSCSGFTPASKKASIPTSGVISAGW
jgi:hypothetical protein